FLVPPQGLMIVADIDGVLRDERLGNFRGPAPEQRCKAFVPWKNMPEVFSRLPTSCGRGTSVHFHYLTTAYRPMTDMYRQFLLSHYPAGSFDTMELGVKNPGNRYISLAMETFPHRKFVLMLDTSKLYVEKAIPKIFEKHSHQITCLLIRDIAQTDPNTAEKVDTRTILNTIPKDRIMFYSIPDDLMGLDFERGDCVNSS
ncbi:hypothetical protein K470DRAFT_205858, partial [Piedraia hortae CBS 480.64]